MHTNHHTARCLVEQCGAHYVMTAVKDNCPNLLAELAGSIGSFLRCAPPASHLGQGTRTNREAKLPGARHRDRAPLPHRQVALSHADGACDRQGRARDRTRPDLRAPRPSHLAGPWPWCAGIGASKIDYRRDSLLRRRPLHGCEPDTCRAISPASPTSPSPSFASRGTSTPSPKPTGTTRRPQDAVRQLINPPKR